MFASWSYSWCWDITTTSQNLRLQEVQFILNRYSKIPGEATPRWSITPKRNLAAFLLFFPAKVHVPTKFIKWSPNSWGNRTRRWDFCHHKERTDLSPTCPLSMWGFSHTKQYIYKRMTRVWGRGRWWSREGLLSPAQESSTNTSLVFVLEFVARAQLQNVIPSL